ncbi:O-antigen ligase family protein [Domibacillus iocasae]|uniref:O-antigen ligase-related domain-containing protein n=1 Tax=Domibacillus iocasae TaxID=1714016 RepID=A0A1E7DPC4_9BACI|nr:O-antigen ligase family protein [Domibacillus iocasae]OES44932.1 hypothetical protein BA724_06625 [Domibacillus iocasae]
MEGTFYQKKEVYREREEDLEGIKKVDRWIFYLLLGVIGFVPLLVGGHMAEVISPHITDISSISTASKGDLFTFYKFVIMLILTILAVAFFLYKLFFLDYRFPKKAPLIIFGGFLFVIVLSAALAPYKTLALFGQYNRTDGTLSYICYITLMFIAMHINYPKKAVQFILFSLYPFVMINVVLMTMNFTGHDAMNYEPVQKWMSLTLPEGANLGEGSILLGTLNQWNYMSGMFAVMTVLFLAASMAEKHLVNKILHFVMALLSISTMLMSVSTSGFLTVCLLSSFLILFAWKLPNRKKAFITLAAFYMLSIPVLHVLSEKNPRVWNDSIGFFISTNPYVPEVTANAASSTVFAADNNFQLPELPESSVAAGSGRTYIWGKTLELVKERPLFGYGLDTLVYHFPHNDIEARSGLRSETIIVDKPHSMYMGMLYGTGIIGFVSFLLLIGAITWKWLVAFVKNKQVSTVYVFGLAWIAFVVQALFNDTLPGTAGPMFAIAGIAIALLDKETLREK